MYLKTICIGHLSKKTTGKNFTAHLCYTYRSSINSIHQLANEENGQRRTQQG